jgi:hypothetical protein
MRQVAIHTVRSGGQSGVDRAALDAAMAVGLPVEGWCPRGRRAEDGRIADRYPLRETPSYRYAQRTAWNVRDSDGTLVLLFGEAAGGTKLTVEEAQRRGSPYHVQRLDAADALPSVLRWLGKEDIRDLNVAGPRESEAPGIYDAAFTVLRRLFRSVKGPATS